MIEVFGQILGSAVGVAISPMPIIAVVLVLISARARTNGPAFAFGWVLGILGLCLVLSLLDIEPSASGPSTTSGWINIVIGSLFLGLAWKQWAARPKAGEPAELPDWMKTIDDLSPVKAMGLALVLSVVNAKNLGLIVGAAVTVSAANLSGGSVFGVTLLFAAVASAAIVIPVVLAVVRGEAMAAPLAAARDWLTQYNTVVMAVLFVILGSSSLGKGIEILAGS